MSFTNLVLNSEFFLYGKPHRVVAIDAPYLWIKRQDGEDQKIAFSRLITHPTFVPGESMKKQRTFEIGNSVLTKLDEQKREEVSERFELIHPILLLEQAKAGQLRAIQHFVDKYAELYLNQEEQLEELTQEILIKRILSARGGSRATIMRYLSKYRNRENENNNAGLEGLISDKGKGYSGRKDQKELVICHPDKPDIILDILLVRKTVKQIEIIKRVIETDYLNKLRMSYATIHEKIYYQCLKEDEEGISYNTVRNIIKRIDQKAKVMFRDLKKAKAMYDEVARGYADREALYPLDIVQIDHTRLDMKVIDEVTGLTIERPWITLGIDVYSRMPWCLFVSFEPPSMNVVRKAIQHGVFAKHTKERFGTEMEWEAFGIPNIIYVDNGLDFRGTDIKRLVNETLKSEIMHRPIRTPHYGAVIERLFRTINDKLIHNLFGTTKSNVQMLGDINADKDACLTLSQIRKVLTIFLTDMYPIGEHKGLSHTTTRTPLLKYREGCNNAGYPEWIDSSEEEKYKIDFMLTAKKPYTRDGVRWDNKIYKAELEKELIAKRTTKYVVKYDLDDISKIYLLHPKTNQYIELKCFSPPYETVLGQSRYVYRMMLKMIRDEADENKNSIPGKDQMTNALERIALEVQEGIKNKKSALKLAQKLGSNIQVTVTNAYHEQQRDQKQNAGSFEEELFLAARMAEERRQESYE